MSEAVHVMCQGLCREAGTGREGESKGPEPCCTKQQLQAGKMIQGLGALAALAEDLHGRHSHCASSKKSDVLF